MKKRVTSLVLALLMALTLLPTTAWAGGGISYASFDVSVWEDGVDPANCNESAFGNGWSYDKEMGILTLDGFDGKYLMIGKKMTVFLKGKNRIAYGMYIGADNYGTVTIAGPGTLEVGNTIDCVESDLEISAAVRLEQQYNQASFVPNITVIEDFGGTFPTEVSTRTPDLSTSGSLHMSGSMTGLIFMQNGELKMNGGQLTIVGTKYGIWAMSVKRGDRHNITGGKVSIVDTTVSAISIRASGFGEDELLNDPSVVLQGVDAFGANNERLIWRADKDYSQDRVKLYTADGEVAKSAAFKSSEASGGRRITGVTVLDEQPIIMVEGVDSYETYPWDPEKGQFDKSKPYIKYNTYDLRNRLTVRAAFSDGTFKEGKIADIPEGKWYISARSGNNYNDLWKVGNNYEVWLQCYDPSAAGWNSTTDPSFVFKVKIVAATAGDIDGDGKTTAVEVQTIYEYLTGQINLSWGGRNLLDVNGDEVLDVYDLQYCYEVASGIRS